jgi:hypothetical protein
MGVVTRAERAWREFRVVGQTIVVVTELGDERRHAEIGDVLAHRRVARLAAGIFVDRCRAGEARILK